ncbi:hypothetical protein NQ317_014710 [Molorchus minor]|uniref:Serpin domain-containing protein n=1 Tax=Molorchus minor TaxID=1323400 RepID=A0ABQ9K0U2_9CUCU|nr:hypothetical protein NQ317_014710 [Molorchus minor]
MYATHILGNKERVMYGNVTSDVLATWARSLNSIWALETCFNLVPTSQCYQIKKVTLGAAQHKAKIEVNEEGTKAASATALFSFRSSRPVEPAQFICNHPFIYFIYDKIQRAVLFAGVFRRPY